LKRQLRIAVLAAAVLSQAGIVHAIGEDPLADSLALLTQATKLQVLRAEGTPPFLLRAHLEVNLNKREIQGEYSLLWQSPNHWREEMRLGDFGRLRVGAEVGYWQERSIDYQPQMIFDLDQLMDVAGMLWVQPTEKVAQLKSRKIGGNAMSCVEIRLKGGVARELCFDPAGGALLHAEIPQSALHDAKVRLTADYSDPQSFGDKQIPRSIRIEKPGRYQMRISLTSLAPLSELNAASFAQPAHSELWGGCRESRSAEISSKKMPEYPPALRQNRQEGVVTIYARIEPDGSTSHLVTLDSTSQAFERSARDAIRQWNFKIPMCGGSPVRSETTIDVFYSIPD
jgi:TonB family protein